MKFQNVIICKQTADLFAPGFIATQILFDLIFFVILIALVPLNFGFGKLLQFVKK